MRASISFIPLAGCVLTLLVCANSSGQLFLSYGDQNVGKIVEYGLDGSLINGSFITGLNDSRDIQISGGYLYVANHDGGTIGKYTLSGTPVNASFVTGLIAPFNLAVAGNSLFVTYDDTFTKLAKCDATTGAVINPTFITGLPDDSQVGISNDGAHLYVTKTNGNGLTEYDAATGAVVADPFTAASGRTSGIAVDGSNLYVSKYTAGMEKYATSGATVNGSFYPYGSGRLDALDGRVYAITWAQGVIIVDSSGNLLKKNFVVTNGNLQGIAVVPEPSLIAVFGAILVPCATRRMRDKQLRVRNYRSPGRESGDCTGPGTGVQGYDRVPSASWCIAARRDALLNVI